MSHMTSITGDGSECGDGGCSGGPRIVEYTATGSELPSGFTIPVGVTLASTDYSVAFFNVEDDIIAPAAWSFPWSGRTTTSFTARFTGDSLTAGGVYKFQIVES